MEKVKMFFETGEQVRNPETMDGITHKINEWLSKMGDKIEITDRVVSSSGNFWESTQMIVLIFYKDKNE